MQWLEKHPQFRSNPLYITGVSYSGLTIPAVVEEIFNGTGAQIVLLLSCCLTYITILLRVGNEAGNEPRINIEVCIVSVNQ